MFAKHKNLIIFGALVIVGVVMYKKYRTKKAAEAAAADTTAAAPSPYQL